MRPSDPLKYLCRKSFEEILFQTIPLKYLGINGSDSMVWLFEKSKLHEDSDEVCLVAWIHSHVRGAECNFSSIDVHAQFAYSKLYHGTVGMVVELGEDGNYVTHDIYELTEEGQEYVEHCGRTRNLSHVQHEECSSKDFYQSVKEEISHSKELKTITLNMMEETQVANIKEKDACKFCQKEFKSLIKHATQAMSCKSLYSESDISILREKAKEQTRKYKKDYNDTNREKIKIKQQIYNTENKKTIRENQ